MGEHESSKGTTDRRAFLIRGGALLLLLPVGWAGAGCFDEEPVVTVMSDERLFISTVTDNHTHDFSLDPQELSQPPSAGISRDTTSTAGHVHIVSLTHDELSLIQANQVVTKDTSITDGHIHTFQFSLTGQQR